ncbi:MAG: sensor histidine kinase [Dehalobacterium sp.]
MNNRSFFFNKITGSIKSRMIFTFVMLIVIFSSTITFFIYNIAKTQLLREIDKSAELTLKSIANYMEGYLSEKAQVSKSMTKNTDVKNFNVFALKTLLPQILKENSELSNAYVSTKEGKIVVFYKDNGKIIEWTPPADYIPADQDWYRLPAKAKKLTITPAYTDEVTGKTMVSFTVPYTDSRGNFKGIVGVDITLNTLVKQVKNINIAGNGKALLIDTNGTILAFNDDSVVMKKVTEQETYPGLKEFYEMTLGTKNNGKKNTYLENDHKIYDIYSSNVPLANWMLVVTIPHSSIMSPVYRITTNFILFGLFGILIFGFVTAFVAGRISKPIIALSKHAQRVAQGDLAANIDITGNDEIGILAHSINDMTINLRKLIEQINSNAESIKIKAQLEKSLKEAELKALQLQINPHFMFNILNSVNRLISLEEYGKAQQVLDAFTKMLRYSMREIGNIVPLEKELDYVKKYLFLQNLRFGNRVAYNIEIDKNLLDFQLPFFTLQPLVENAIIHGLEPKESGGVIRILVKIINNNVVIYIQDNGLGIAEEKLLLLKNIDDLDEQSSTGIGIGNVHNRLKLFFEDNYSFDITSKPNQGTIITLTIKMNRQQFL